MSALKIKIYKPEGFCPRCNGAKRRLDSLNLDYEEKISEESDILAFREKGYQTFPVIEIAKSTGDTVKTIVGLDINELDSIPELMSSFA